MVCSTSPRACCAGPGSLTDRIVYPSPQPSGDCCPWWVSTNCGGQSPRLLLPAEMELDFGGIGKEYAVDRAYELLAAGDCDTVSRQFRRRFARQSPAFARAVASGNRASGYRPRGRRCCWIWSMVRSCDERRLAPLSRKGRDTIWPYPGSANRLAGARLPRSVTVAASSCTEAGLLSTLALLHGSQAGQFLEDQGVRHWIQL